MNILARAALVWLIALLPAQATILVYHGSGRQFTATQPAYSAAEGCYLIVDLNANEMTLIFYGTLLHKKTQTLAVNQATLDYASVPGTGAHIYEVFAEVSRVTPFPGAFGDDVAMFRGLEGSVNISGSPSAFNTGAHPRTLVGLYRHFGLGLQAAYEEHTFSLVFNQPLTLQANNGSLTISQVQANVSANLQTAGYSP